MNPDEAARARGEVYVEVIAQPRLNKVIIKQEDKPTSTVDSSNSIIYAESGQVGRGWNNYMNNPQNFPNTTFHSNGYTFRTDSLGRPENVCGKLTLKKTNANTRNSNAPVKAGGSDRGSDDHGGHLIASMFNGPGESLNLVPMDRWVNGAGGDWYVLENKWKDALNSKQTVEVDITPIYTDGSRRPTSFIVKETIENGEPREISIDNFKLE